jgi:hypothetical protein
MHADWHPQIELALTLLFFGAIIAVFGLGVRLSKKMGYRLPFQSKDDLPIMLGSIEFYLILVILPIAILAMLVLDQMQHGGPN